MGRSQVSVDGRVVGDDRCRALQPREHLLIAASFDFRSPRIQRQKCIADRSGTICAIPKAAPALLAELNRVFDLVRGATKKFQLSIKPKPGYKASALTIPIRVFCLNANSPAATSRNTVMLTF